MPRPRSLSTSQISAAALTVLERDGLAVLSMRAVAGELGVGTMSLYRYVTGRDQLEGLLLERVLDGVELDVPSDDPWDARVATLSTRVWRVTRNHPGIVPVMLTRRAASPTSAAWGEAVMSALRDGGFSAASRVVAFRTVVSYLVGAVQFQHYGPLTGAGTAAIAALPSDRFPVLAETAAHAGEVTPDEEFRRGLTAVLAGLDATGRAAGDDR